jgi:hypothetical protein
MYLVLVAVLAGVTLAWVASTVTDMREEQTEQGLFGETAREGLISRWVAAAVDLAERQVRLAYFGSALRARIWEGAVAEIDGSPRSGRLTTWRFAGGDVWLVRVDGAVPRTARRIVVRSVEQRGPRLAVDVYVPGRLEVSLSVVDAEAQL